MATHIDPPSDDVTDMAIRELYVRAGQRKPVGGDDYRWSAEGPRRVRDLDTVREWVVGRP
jgi:hypothetical protein